MNKPKTVAPHLPTTFFSFQAAIAKLQTKIATSEEEIFRDFSSSVGVANVREFEHNRGLPPLFKQVAATAFTGPGTLSIPPAEVCTLADVGGWIAEAAHVEHILPAKKHISIHKLAWLWEVP